MGWDRHKLPCDGTDKYVPWTILQNTHIARIKMLHSTFPTRNHSASKSLIATLMHEVITVHEKCLKVHLPVVPDGVLTYGKSKSALKYSNGIGMWFQSVTFIATEWFLLTEKKKFFSISAGGL